MQSSNDTQYYDPAWCGDFIIADAAAASRSNDCVKNYSIYPDVVRAMWVVVLFMSIPGTLTSICRLARGVRLARAMPMQMRVFHAMLLTNTSMWVSLAITKVAYPENRAIGRDALATWLFSLSLFSFFLVETVYVDLHIHLTMKQSRLFGRKTNEFMLKCLHDFSLPIGLCVVTSAAMPLCILYDGVPSRAQVYATVFLASFALVMVEIGVLAMLCFSVCLLISRPRAETN